MELDSENFRLNEKLKDLVWPWILLAAMLHLTGTTSKIDRRDAYCAVGPWKIMAMQIVLRG